MEPIFVSVITQTKRQSRRAKRRNKKIKNTTHIQKVSPINLAPPTKPKPKPKPKSVQPLQMVNVWQKSNHQQKSVNKSIKQIQNEQLEIQQNKPQKLLYESTTNHNFLLSLTLSKIKTDPSLIICASYICRICQNLNLFIPSSIIILCQKYYHYQTYAKYLHFFHTINAPNPTVSDKKNHTFLDLSNKNFGKKIWLSHCPSISKHGSHDICIAPNIHLKYPNLIKTIDKDNLIVNWNKFNVHAILEWRAYGGCFCCDNPPDYLKIDISLFMDNGCVHLNDGGHTLKFVEKNNFTYNGSIVYDNQCGLILQMIKENKIGNNYYELVANAASDDGLYNWKPIKNVYNICNKSLMSILGENLFICNNSIVCLYNFENKLWNQLECIPNDIDINSINQLYYDSMCQRMLCMSIIGGLRSEYVFDNNYNKWMKCNTSILFNYYNVFKDKWYNYPSIHTNLNAQKTNNGLIWNEENNPNIMYCAILDSNSFSKSKNVTVKYFDNRSSNQWKYHWKKTQILKTIVSRSGDCLLNVVC